MQTVKMSHITDRKNILFLLLNPFNIFIKLYSCSVSTFVSPLPLFINRDLRVEFYYEFIINVKPMDQNSILSIGDHFSAIDLRTGAIEN